MCNVIEPKRSCMQRDYRHCAAHKVNSSIVNSRSIKNNSIVTFKYIHYTASAGSPSHINIAQYTIH